MQVRRARAWQADDEHRCDDSLPLDRGIGRALGFHAQQIVEQAHDELACRDASERREPRLVAIRFQQAVERLREIPRSVVAASRARLCGAVQALDVERRRLDSKPATAAAVPPVAITSSTIT